MKKSILIFSSVLVAISFMAFSYVNWSQTSLQDRERCSLKTDAVDSDLLNLIYTPDNTEVLFNIDSRFLATITKENLHAARSIVDIYPPKATELIESYQEVEIAILHHNADRSKRESGIGPILNARQLNLIQSLDYSSNIHLSANSKKKRDFNDKVDDYQLSYAITIVPEKEAEYADGYDSLIAYIKENSKEETAIVNRSQLQPGKVSFTVNKAGTISDVNLISTSGYNSIDEVVVELLGKIPGKWNPASNSKGEIIEQELILFFGIQGC